ncbi:Rogdi leucine zipper containing protein [Glomus cerebriforme]|uniref:Rogdi leucine zipper containing protein n=1 Tax=Glomus cerebriforme TaxID=658196 RepID=A0A397SKV0_9GLOM|nr:Rogdi leucine zipper containing protein [Glomus cerebriforme]
MAGAQDDNRQHFKKQQNRQDYNGNAKRKNSFAGNNKNVHNTTLPPTGTVTTSPTTPTSTSSNHTSFAGSGPALPSLKPAPDHVPVNNFNAQEVSNYLNNTWKETFDRYHDSNIPEAEKPELYRSDKAWGNGHVWGQKGHLMANGKDFYSELRKSSLAQASNAQPATANNDFLKGFITLDGSDIIKGELSVKLSSYNRGNLIKITINTKKPYFIEQLVDAQNYLTLALDALDRTSKDLTKESARELLDSVLIYIISSRSVLVCAHEEKLFPYKICDPQMFGTAIPEDLVIQFHVEGSSIVCSVYGLQYHSSLPSQKKNGGLLGTSKSSKICKYKDKYASILDEVIVKSHDPKLEEVMEGLEKLERECLAWKGKIALFKNLEMEN